VNSSEHNKVGQRCHGFDKHLCVAISKRAVLFVLHQRLGVGGDIVGEVVWQLPGYVAVLEVENSFAAETRPADDRGYGPKPLVGH
jgi:hypothetical protein